MDNRKGGQVVISLIVAMAPDGLIGHAGGLPWHLPADLRRFRCLTMGKPIVMGRRTFESIGRPLDGRLNIVLTHRDDYHPEGSRVARSLDEALAIAREHLAATGGDEVMVLGGASVFREALPRAGRWHRTIVKDEFAGDTYFPLELVDPAAWWLVSDEPHPPDDRNPHPYRFQVLERHRENAPPATPPRGERETDAQSACEDWSEGYA